MYKVLYRKYRPRFFSDVVDQPQVTVTLKNELVRGRIAHAYLFAGSRGTGKTTCAKILARAVNCLHPINGDPCGECEICRGLEDGSIMDVVEIDAASNNGVDSIRSLIEESSFTPATAKYRVYIIDEVHMLSTAAFNALLKTLEEPPAHVIFILATTEIHKLLPTILSRCQLFTFKRISPEAIADRLSEVAQKEDAAIDREAALLIARLSDGAMRDALSLLDQCLGRSNPVTLETVNQTAGVAARNYLWELSEAIFQQDCAAALSVIDLLHRESKDMSRLCEELSEYFRGLMIFKTMRNASSMLAVSAEEEKAMTRQAAQSSLSTILHGLDTFEETLNKMRYATPRVELEMAFVRLCSPELDTSGDALVRRIEALERKTRLRVTEVSMTEPEVPVRSLSKESVPEPAVEPQQDLPLEDLTAEKAALFDGAPSVADLQEPTPQPKVHAEPTPPAKPPQRVQSVDMDALVSQAKRFREWPEVLQAIRDTTKSVAMAFSGSTAYISGDYMLIDAPDIAFDLLKRPEQRKRIRDVIRQVTGRAYNLGPYRKRDPKESIDPLEELTLRAKNAGIEVIEENPPTPDDTE